MANEKITNLTDLAAPEGADVAAVVDDVAGTPTTKKMTLSKLIPTGGTDGQVLTKTGVGYGASAWEDIPTQVQMAVFERRSNPATFVTMTVTPIGVNEEIFNNISGMSMSGGIVTVPAGLYKVDAYISGFLRSEYALALLYSYSGGAISTELATGSSVYSGNTTNASYRTSGTSIINTMLNLASATDIVLCANVTRGSTQMVMGIDGAEGKGAGLSFIKIPLTQEI